jgi:hypothetical protein
MNSHLQRVQRKIRLLSFLDCLRIDRNEVSFIIDISTTKFVTLIHVSSSIDITLLDRLPRWGTELKPLRLS